MRDNNVFCLLFLIIGFFYAFVSGISDFCKIYKSGALNFFEAVMLTLGQDGRKARGENKLE